MGSGDLRKGLGKEVLEGFGGVVFNVESRHVGAGTKQEDATVWIGSARAFGSKVWMGPSGWSADLLHVVVPWGPTCVLFCGWARASSP